MRYKSIAHIILFTCISLQAFGQSIPVYDANLVVQGTITEDTVSQIKQEAKVLVEEYVNLGSFLDVNDKISSEKMSRFLELFSSNCQFFDDLSADKRVVTPQVYVNTVFNYVKEYGVSFKVSEVSLQKLSKNAFGDYELQMKMFKTTFTQIDNNLQVLENRNAGFKHELDIIVKFPFEDLSNPYITRFWSEEIKKVSRKTFVDHSFLLKGMYGGMLLSAEANNGFDLTSLSETNFLWGAGFGYEFSRSIFNSKWLHLLVGLGVDFINLQQSYTSSGGVQLTDSLFYENISNVPVSYLKDGTVSSFDDVSGTVNISEFNSADERFRILNGSVLLGLGIKLYETRNSQGFFKLGPSIHFPVAQLGYSRDSLAVQARIIPDDEFLPFPSEEEAAAEIENFYTGSVNDQTGNVDPSYSTFSLKINASYDHQIFTAYNKGFSLGLFGQFGLLSMFDKSDDNDPFNVVSWDFEEKQAQLGADRTSIFSEYLSSSRDFSFGIRLGFFLNNNE